MKKLFITLLIIYSYSFSQNACSGTPTLSYGNKIYNTVQIGNQCWLKENLNIGTMIHSSGNQTNNGIIEKYCYDDDPANCEKLGGLYTWDEAVNYSSIGSRLQDLCPSGWRLPTVNEFQELKAFVKNDGGALKEKTTAMGALENSNSSGFSALLTGSRGNIRNNGSYFSHIDVYAFFWSSTEVEQSFANIMELDYLVHDINIFANGKAAAFSIRCIKGEGISDISNENPSCQIPKDYALDQNYPNPFNPTTNIKFSLPKSGNVKIIVYDAVGREVATLVNNTMAAGTHTVQFNATGLASGIYLYRIESKDFVKVNKMLLIK
jgi:uncharacterized protein (TIGR02145 family)